MNLDNSKQFAKLDQHGVAKSLELLPDQIRQVLEEARLVSIPKEYSKITEVVLAGMGGSNLSAHILRSALGDTLKKPLTIAAGYQVPAHIGPQTLFVLSSYSGTTEETLSVYKEAKKRGAKIIALTADMPKNKLKALMMKEDIPGYVFQPIQNPSGQPRLAVAYAVFGLSVLLAKAGVHKIEVKEMEDIIASLEIWSRRLRVNVKTAENRAKQIAQLLAGRTPVLVGAEHLAGNLHALRNQINENAKLFSTYLELPDLNHHAMEGLINPKSNKNNLFFVFFDSKLYHKRVQKRNALTKTVVEKNGIKFAAVEMTGKTKLLQSYELLQFGSWLSYYLGALYDVDPIKIPWVDWFKGEMGK